MNFTEKKREPEFELKLSLKEAISLWQIVSESSRNGNENAKSFVDALHNFAARSNSYSEYLDY